MVLLLERENGTPPLSHHDQWRRGFACKTDADCASAPALDEPCSPIGLAGTGAIPEPEMNSRFFCRQRRRCGLSQGYSSTTGLALQRSTSLPVITFPLMTHPTWELRLAGSLNWNRRIFRRCCASVFYAICVTVLQNHAAATTFSGL